MIYLDKNGTEIKAGNYLFFPDGRIEKVYACMDKYGNEDLGINASNESFMRAHGLDECEREFYSLSSFNVKETKVL